MDPITLVVVAVIALFVLTVAVKSVLVIPQAQAAVIERLGRYPFLTLLVDEGAKAAGELLALGAGHDPPLGTEQDRNDQSS